MGKKMKIPGANPKVSVCVVTYNHEKYIGECLQSILEQDTDFDFEVLIGEDSSTDGTLAIVTEFAKKYPTLVKLIARPKNIGPFKNYQEVHKAARGKYIAHMDGDDFALPGKLQAQADYLDMNPDVSFCAHEMQVLGSKQIMGGDARYPTLGAVDDLLKHGTYFANSSVMYRRENESRFSDEIDLVDFYYHIERASKGPIFLDRRVFGCYRLHAGNMSRSPQFRDLMEKAYEAAFDRALELGARKELVQSARLRRRMVFAIGRYLSGDVAGYKRKIRIHREQFSFASKKHWLLHWTRFFPSLLGIYLRIRRLT